MSFYSKTKPNTDAFLYGFENNAATYLHFFYHIDRRKTDMGQSTPQSLHYAPLQQLHIPIVEEPAIPHPSDNQRIRIVKGKNVLLTAITSYA